MEEEAKAKTLDEVIEEARAEAQEAPAEANGDTHAPEEEVEGEASVEISDEELAEIFEEEPEAPKEPEAPTEDYESSEGADNANVDESGTVDEPETPLNGEERPTPSEEVEEATTGFGGKTFSQDEVNSLVGNTRKEARDKVLKELFGQYGVNGREELDNVFGKGQAYDLLNEDYVSLSAQLKELQAENALLKSNIDRDRWDDAKAILNSKGMDITSENILAMAETHPEWMPKDTSRVLSKEDMEGFVKAKEEKKLPKETPSTIKKFGVDVDSNDEVSNEREQVMKNLFGL